MSCNNLGILYNVREITTIAYEYATKNTKDVVNNTLKILKTPYILTNCILSKVSVVFLSFPYCL